MSNLSAFVRNVAFTGSKGPLAPRPLAFAERKLIVRKGLIKPEELATWGSNDPRSRVALKAVGAPWPDGSIRFLELECLVKDLGGNEERQITIESPVTEPAPAPWEPSGWIQRAAFFAFNADGIGHQSENWEVEQTSAINLRMRQRVRFGPDGSWCATVDYDAVSGLDHVPFHMQVEWTDPRHNRMSTVLATGVQASIDVPCLGVVRASDAHAAAIIPHAGAFGFNIQLLARATVVDGQGIAVRGSLVMMPPEVIALMSPSMGVSPETVAFAFGELMRRGEATPDMLPRIMGNVAELEVNVRVMQRAVQDGASHSPLPFLPALPAWILPADARRRADEWAVRNMAPLLGSKAFQQPRLGHLPNPEGTGNQADLGLLRGEQALLGESVLAEEAIIRSVEFEAGRPSHVREADGFPVMPLFHPSWRTWGGRTHFSPSESPDRLGKGTAPLPPAAGDLEQRGWEHFTINYLYAAWLAGESLAAAELKHLAVIWQTTAKGVVPQSFLNSPGAARHTARFIWSGMQLYLATGSRAILDLCLWRANATRPSTGPVGTVIAVRDPATNFLPTEKSWIGYEEACAAVSLYALGDMLGDGADKTRLQELAWQVLRMVVRFGFAVQPNGVAIPATAIAWNNGTELTPVQLADTQFRTLFPGSDYNWWMLPGILLARQIAGQKGDAAIAAQANTIAHGVRRQAPADGSWDDKGAWLVSVAQPEQIIT